MKDSITALLLNLATLFLGILLTLSFAPYEIFPFAVVSLAGLFYLWLNVTPKGALWRGFLFGIGYFGTGVYWVFISIHQFGGVPNFLAFLITSAMVLFLALFPSSVGYLATRFFDNNKSLKLICALPALWVLSEWVRSWVFTGFPWLLAGYSQTNSPLRGYAPIFSVYGVTLAMTLSSGLLINSLCNFKQKAYYRSYLSLFALISIWILGNLLNLIPWSKPIGSPLPVSLVQGNIPQQLKWSPDHLKLSFDRYESLTQPLWAKNQIIIWPEAAIPLSLQAAADFIKNMDEKALAEGAHLVLGIPIQATGEDYYNAIIALGNDKKMYVKRRLVPFGEYTPFPQVFRQLFSFMNIPMSDLIPGKLQQEPFILNNIKFLPFICYEIAFPELVNNRDGSAQALLTVTNDAWFGESAAQAQHLQMAVMRAIELRRPVLFVSNNGITAIIGPNGEIESQIPPHQTAVLKGTLQPAQGLTPWMKNGMDPILFILLCLLFFAIRENLKKPATQLLTNERETHGTTV